MKLEGPAVARRADGLPAQLGRARAASVGGRQAAKLFPTLPTCAAARRCAWCSTARTKRATSTPTAVPAAPSSTAQKSITIENAYFLPPPELREALIDAAKRGVEVQVMTNSRASNDIGLRRPTRRATSTTTLIDRGREDLREAGRHAALEDRDVRRRVQHRRLGEPERPLEGRDSRGRARRAATDDGRAARAALRQRASRRRKPVTAARAARRRASSPTSSSGRSRTLAWTF